ncbi:MAG: YbhB YbcL family protein [Candidatus Eremiobacteraeota bacterium]|nr:YbhB YbcL family protein [Candidatus Eremiobacteraeota bacterium]
MLIPVLLAMVLTSPDVHDGATVPKKHVWNADGCGGDNVAPHLRWDRAPHGTRTLALSVVDPDAPKPGGWVHWLVFGIPGDTRKLDRFHPRHVVDAKNDFGTVGWGGPCPPPGPTHHYVFQLDALDIAPNFTPSTTLEQYRARVRGHVIASVRMVPVYKR